MAKLSEIARWKESGLPRTGFTTEEEKRGFARAEERLFAERLGAQMSEEEVKTAADTIMEQNMMLMMYYQRGLEAARHCMLTSYKRKGKGFWVIEGAVGAAASISERLSEDYYAVPVAVKFEVLHRYQEEMEKIIKEECGCKTVLK